MKFSKLLEDNEIYSEISESYAPRGYKWNVVFSKGKYLSEPFSFQVGSAWRGNIEEELLSSIHQETHSILDCFTYEEWDDNEGIYGKDSRKGEEVFNAMKKNASNLRKLLGYKLWAEFLALQVEK